MTEKTMKMLKTFFAVLIGASSATVGGLAEAKRI
jgi:hypothetical protein